ncbi:MAG: hypothetical protein WC948_05925 [Thermovirgaceae bacterium]|jgi:hypothetical protein
MATIKSPANRELFRLVHAYVQDMGCPLRARPHWIAKDLEDEHGKAYMDTLRTTQTLKSSVELCLKELGYIDEGICGGKVWIQEEQMLRPPAPCAERQLMVAN